MDLNVTPDHETALWNETRWNGCWNAEAGVGLYLHAGRFRHDLDIWWAQAVAYLPDRRLAVQRVFGPNAADAGVSTGPFDLRMTETGWTATFDGVGELTTIEGLARGARGASAPNARMRWEVTATAVSDVWDMYAASHGERLAHAGDMHIQQGFETTGTLRVGDESYALDGIGFKDHSSGPRVFSDSWQHHNFLLLVGPEWTAHMVTMHGLEDGPVPAWGSFIPRDGEAQIITRFEFPTLETAEGGPFLGDLVFETEGGDVHEYAVELVHQLPMQVTEQNDNNNGIDWSLPGNPVVLIEGFGRLTSKRDGHVLHCFHERTGRFSNIPAPDGIAPPEAARTASTQA